MKTRMLVMVTLSIFVLASLLHSQEPRRPPNPPHPAPAPEPSRHPGLGMWWKNSDIARDLELSSDQISRIEKVFYDHRLKLIDLRADVERQEAYLQPLVEADQPDEAKVGSQIDLLLAARGKLEKANMMMLLAIRKVLSVDQWKKLEVIRRGRAEVRAPQPPRPPQPPRAPAPPQPPDV